MTKDISDVIYSVKVSEPAEISLAYILRENPEQGNKILAQLKFRLPYDPYPDIDGEQDLFHSEVVQSLEREDYEVRRLKSREFLGYRVFYIVDDDKCLIYVLEVVPRVGGTYNASAGHMQTIKDLYIRYYTSKYGC